MGTMTNFGNWMMTAASGTGLLVSIFNFFWQGNGIHGSGGALLVTASSALIFAASLLMALDRSAPRWLRTAVDVLLFLGITLTGLAAYMLEAYLLIGLMVFALIGWFVQLFAGHGGGRRSVDMRLRRAS